MEYKSIQEYIGNDLTNVYRVTDYGDWPVRSMEGIPIKDDECFLFHPMLGYGDYQDSSEIHRSNVRVFEKKFEGVDGWRTKKADHNSVSVIIDVLCTNQQIIETLIALDVYCTLDDQDASALLIEMEEEAWQDCLMAEFTHALEKHFKADFSDPDADPLWNLYCKLKEETNTAVVLNGSEIRVDLKRMIADLADPPEFLHLEFW